MSDCHIEILFTNIVRTLKGVLYDISSIVSRKELVSMHGYNSFQSTVCQILMELLVLVQDSEGAVFNIHTPSVNTLDVLPNTSHSPFLSTGLSLYPDISAPSYQHPFQIPVMPPPGLIHPLPPLPNIPVLGQQSPYPSTITPFPPPGLQPIDTMMHVFGYSAVTDGSDVEASDRSEKQTVTSNYEYLEIDFPQQETKRIPLTPKRMSSLPGSPSSSLRITSSPQLRAPFSPNKWATGSTTNVDASKAKLEAKCKEAERRRNSLLQTKNTRLKKELDEVIMKTAQVRKQLEEENALLQTQFTERQTRAQVLRESQLLAVQEAAKNSIQRVALASQRRAQYAEETMKSLKARYELINSRREEFNKRIKEKALSSTNRHKENMKDSLRDSKNNSPQLIPKSLPIQNNDFIYKRVDTIWPPGISTSMQSSACMSASSSTDHLSGKTNVSIYNTPDVSALSESIDLYSTLTLQWVALQQLAVTTIKNISKFYIDTTFSLREYSSKAVSRAEKVLTNTPSTTREKTTNSIDTQLWMQYLLSWNNSRYKIKDANSAESTFSDTIAIIGHDHSEIHMYAYATVLSIAAVTPNYVHKCIAAGQEAITLLEKGSYSDDEISLLADVSILALFLVSSYLRFNTIFLGQCIEHPEIKSIYTCSSIPVTNSTRYLNKTPGICKEALMYALISVALKMLHAAPTARTKSALDAFFGDGFIIKGICSRINMPIIPSESFLVRSDSMCTELAILYDNFSAVQQALRIAIYSFLLYNQDDFTAYFQHNLSYLCKVVISCLSQLLLSSTSFMSHSKEKKNFYPRSLARHVTDTTDVSDLTASQLFFRHQKGAEDYILAVDLQSIVAECFTLLSHLVTHAPDIFVDVLSDDVILLEMSHSLSVLPLPGALFADEPSPYVNMQIPYCVCFPRYYVISTDELTTKPNTYGVNTIYCTRSKDPTLMLSTLRVTGSPQVILQANVYPFEAVVHDCRYTTLSSALLCGLIFMRNALQLKHRVIRQIVSFAEEPIVIISAISSLPVECFIDGFLRKEILDPIFRAAKEYSTTLSSDLPDNFLDNNLLEDQSPVVSEMLLPLLKLS